MRLVPRLCLAVAMLAAAFSSPAIGRDMVVVPPDNRFEEQPPVPRASALRTRAFNTTYEEKYEKIVELLRREDKLIHQIKQAAAAYAIEPIHIIGALVGEHTYNITAVDKVQTYYVKALAYADLDFTFRYKGTPVQAFASDRNLRDVPP